MAMKITAEEFRRKLDEDSDSWAIVPKAVALNWLGITSPTFEKWLKAGTIQELKIVGAERAGRCILAKSILSVLAEKEKRKEKTRSTLEECAKNRNTVTYSKLMNRVGMTPGSPYDRSVMGKMLGEISRETAREHGFMLSALAVLKSNGLPSDGFFLLAEELAEEFRGKKGKKRHLASYNGRGQKTWSEKHMQIIYDRADRLDSK